MIKLWNSIGFFLQILLVVAAVLVFSYFDPFGFLSSKKLTLENTPVSVKSIKDMGELITAEYYGEVLSSLREVYIEQITFSTDDEFKKDMLRVNEDFQEAMTFISDSVKLKGPGKRKKLQKYFQDNYPEIAQHYYYPDYIDNFLGKTYSWQKGAKTKTTKPDSEREFLKMLYDHSELIEELTLDSAFFANLEQEKKKEFTENKKIQKKQIVLIGRGWVKAGFKFDKFTEKNFRYIADRNKIYFIGLKPEILNADINPWFIPDKKIKGFDIILATKKVRRDPGALAQVKESCLNKLRQQAMDRDILGQAQINAQENLKSFFSLLLEEDIESVNFVNHEIDYYRDAILDDGKIMDDEVYMVDSVLSKYYPVEPAQRDTARVFAFLDSLALRPFELLKSNTELNAYSSRKFHILKDEMINIEEFKYLKSQRSKYYPTNQNYQPDYLDSLWYHNYKKPADIYEAKKADFEKNLKIIEEKMLHFIDSDSVHHEGENAKTLFLEKLTKTERDTVQTTPPQ
ncbi:MAG: DUF4230 domain-containing protein [Bacteroidota bacterium]